MHTSVIAGMNAGSVIGSRRFEKSSASAKFFAFASRTVIGFRPQRHSIIFSTEQCS